MPIQMGFCRSEISKQQICCCTCSSIIGLAWGTFLLMICLTYENPFIWKEICLLSASVVIAVSLIFLILNLIGLLWKEMCCFQENFLICEIEGDETRSEQPEPTNESPVNTASRNYDEIPLNREQASSITVAETYFDISSPTTATSTQREPRYFDISNPISTIPTQGEYRIQKERQYEDNLQCQPIYMVPFEDDHPIKNAGTGGKVRATRSLIPQRTNHYNYDPNMSSICSKESSVNEPFSQDGMAAARLQRETHTRNRGISNELYMSTETSFNECNDMPLYENMPYITSSSTTRPKEFAPFNKSPVRRFNVKAIAENKSPEDSTDFVKSSSNLNLKAVDEKTSSKDVTHKESNVKATTENLTCFGIPSHSNLNVKTTGGNSSPKSIVYNKFSSRHINAKAIAGNTTSRDAMTFGKPSPRCCSIESMVENTVPKEFAVSDNSSSRYVNTKSIVKNSVTENLAVSTVGSSRYINVAPMAKKYNL